RSNFFVDQAALAGAVGALMFRVDDPAAAARVAADAVRTAVTARRTVLLNLPLHVQAERVVSTGSTDEPVGSTDGSGVSTSSTAGDSSTDGSVVPSEGDVDLLAEAVRSAERPVFVAGRGSRGAGPAVSDAAEVAGALLAESAVAKGLFAGHPWSLGVSGGFASPGAADLISSADLIVGWGCAPHMWDSR